MNIVYGVSGEGQGHVFEALEIAALLREEGHRLKVLTYGARACEALAGFSPLRIEGLPLHFGRRGLSLSKTLLRNRHVLPFYLKHYRRLRETVASFQPDVFLTAYEPFTTHLAHSLGKPLISMDNQNELLHLPRPEGADAVPYQLARWATRFCTRGAAHYIVKSFHKPAPSRPHVHFVFPIIQREIQKLRPTTGRHVLVYLTKPNADLIRVLQAVDEVFLVYGQNLSGSDRNIHYRPPGPDYLRDLSDCKAVLGTTGFSLIADAAYLKKPYFGVPLKKQFEQTHNARFLRSAGLGEFAENPSPAELDRFFARLPEYQRGIERLRLDPMEQTATLRSILGRMGREFDCKPEPVTAASR